MLLPVFRRADAPFFFEDLAEIGGRVKAALQGDLGHVAAAGAQHGAGFPDLDGVEIRHQRDPQMSRKQPAKMILGDVKMGGDLGNVCDVAVVFVDVPDNPGDALVAAGGGNVSIGSVGYGKQELVQPSA